MVSLDTRAGDAAAPARNHALHAVVWRWHFYAGLYVIPFFIMLACTGMAMLWIAWIDGRDGERLPVIAQGAPMSVSEQAAAAVSAVPGGTLVQYVAPRAPDLAAIFRVDLDGAATMVAVDPYAGQALAVFPRRSGWYDMMDSIHADLMLGVTGDRMVEIAASLGILLLVSGLYLWVPRSGAGMRRAFRPDLGAKGRSLWKSLHGVVGLWISVFLLFFLLSGLSWAGVWGGKYVQAWSTFPAGKWGGAPASDITHASMNHGGKEVPWALEQTPMPASGSDAALPAPMAAAPDLDGIDAYARQIGFDGRYQLNLPAGETGVWTLSRDSMNTDSPDPTADRTVHVDRYTGAMLADIRYDDYSWAGKAMAVGIALHMGTLGLWSVLANTLFCLAVIFLCVSGAAMWWKRRPSGAMRLSPPPMPRDLTRWKGAAVLLIALSALFPMAGVTLLAVLALDYAVIRRLPALKRALG
jgi:uncharacterized iron-regulated membrane protein